MLADPQAIVQARVALASPSAEQRAYAVEVIDNQVPQELKPLVIPLLSDLSTAQKLQRLAAAIPQQAFGRDARLAEIIAGTQGQLASWTRVCAIHAAGELRLGDLTNAVIAAQDRSDPLLCETAIWAAARLEPIPAEYTALAQASGVRSQESEAGSHRDAIGTRNAGPTALSAAGGKSMLSRIEKVLILKTVGIFHETPDDVLADIAALLDETEVPAGTAIFHKGDTGTSMYIIVDGEVRAHDGIHTLNHLYARDVFGEMALLDPEPRSASITALADTRLLRLDQEPFYELMDAHTQVARGIIRVLTRHLRDRVRDLADARGRDRQDLGLRSQEPEA
jgi:hypothetical protein